MTAPSPAEPGHALPDGPGTLQIHEVERQTPSGAICVVRCVGGLVLLGQLFTTDTPSRPADTPLRLELARIERYPGVLAESLDPPHAARVHLTGEHAERLLLGRGDLLRSAPMI
ncbi:hypothetical protein GCM10010232_02500 [Streptomyces amakusaensis]|uniref:Uncharacterized protein n=1 Tax=Streptomyces amakusaensis TaxID=67271 RepID=A0ABW0AN42_9ACTN